MISRHTGGPCRSSQDTPNLHNLQLSRDEEKALQIRVAGLYQTLITDPIRSIEYLQWEGKPARLRPNKKTPAPLESPGERLFEPSRINLYRYMLLCPQLGRDYVVLLCLGRDAFGVDVNLISTWWLRYHTMCERIMLVYTYKVPNIGIPGYHREFASYDMFTLMQNLTGIRHDIMYQSLIRLWHEELGGRVGLSEPHRVFAAVSERGRNSRTL